MKTMTVATSSSSIEHAASGIKVASLHDSRERSTSADGIVAQSTAMQRDITQEGTEMDAEEPTTQAVGVGRAGSAMDEVASYRIKEKRLLRKIDLHLLPWCCAAYLINYFDRTALASARILNEDKPGNSLDDLVDLSGTRYSLVVAIYFVLYSLFEMPSNFLLKLFRPSIWFARIMFTWSLVACCQAAVSNYAGLLISRAALGLAEAGLFPGVIFYLTFWYRPEEQAFRLSLFTASIALSGAFGGLIATGISFANGAGGLYGWQWLFLTYGIPGIILSVFIYFFMPDFPQTAKFLTEEEREMAVNRLDRGSPSMHDRHFDWEEVKTTVLSLDFWLFSIAVFLMTNSLNAASYFIPTLVADLGFVGYKAQLMTVPPNAFGFIIVVGNAIWSDVRKERVSHILGGLTLISTGYLLLALTTAVPARLVGVFFIACTNAAVIPFLAFRTATITGSSGTAAATGFAFAIAQLSGVSSPFLFPSHQGPRYIMGNWTIFSMQVLAAIIVVILWRRLGSSALRTRPNKSDLSLDRLAGEKTGAVDAQEKVQQEATFRQSAEIAQTDMPIEESGSIPTLHKEDRIELQR